MRKLVHSLAAALIRASTILERAYNVMKSRRAVLVAGRCCDCTYDDAIVSCSDKVSNVMNYPASGSPSRGSHGSKSPWGGCA